MTGPAAQLGIQFHAGAKMYFEQLNAQGGIGGRTVEIALLDDGYEPDRCAENTQKFIDQDVFALFAYVGTPTSLAALPLAAKAHLPFIAPYTGAPALRTGRVGSVFHVRASYNEETALIVRNLANLGLKKIGVFYQNDAYGKAGLDGVTQALSAIDLKPAVTAVVERNSVEVAAAAKLIADAGPDAVVQISAYKSCAAFIRAARKAGYGGQFFNVSFVGTQALSDELGKDAAGVVVSQVMPYPYLPVHPFAREFLSAVARTNGAVKANYSSIEGYLAARVVSEGLRRSGSKGGRDGFISGLESLGSTAIGGFPITLSKTQHVASNFVELSLLTPDGRVRV